MLPISGIDHVAVTVANLDDTCDFYVATFGAHVLLEHSINGRAAVRQLAIGGAMLSIHQQGNGVHPVAINPTMGAADICLRCELSLSDLVKRLDSLGIKVIEGPAPRHTADGQPSMSVYFRDPDGNLIELMVTT